jgi:hypothetical protein
MSNRTPASRGLPAVPPASVNDRQAEKRAWQTPSVTRTPVADTANATGMGPDGGTFS